MLHQFVVSLCLALYRLTLSNFSSSLKHIKCSELVKYFQIDK